MAKHLTKEEIMYKLWQRKAAVKSASTTTPMVMTTVCMYTLWKYFNFSANQLVKLQEYMIAHIDDDAEECNKIIKRKTGWEIYREDEEVYKKTGIAYFDKLQDEIKAYDKSSYDYAQRYISVMMKYLITEKGFGKQRLEKLKTMLEEMINNETNEYNAFQMRAELAEGTGIVTTFDNVG